MTDLEMTRACAEAMGFDVFDDYRDCNPPVDGVAVHGEGDGVTRYHPLTNDAQAMALVKEFHLILYRLDDLTQGAPQIWWVCGGDRPDNTEGAENADLNRAIVECVAKMAVTAPPQPAPDADAGTHKTPH